MTILSFFKNHFTSSRYASDQAVYDFARVAQDQGLPLDFGNDWRLAELLGSNEDPVVNLDDIAKLFGPSSESPKP